MEKPRILIKHNGVGGYWYTLLSPFKDDQNKMMCSNIDSVYIMLLKDHGYFEYFAYKTINKLINYKLNNKSNE